MIPRGVLVFQDMSPRYNGTIRKKDIRVTLF